VFTLDATTGNISGQQSMSPFTAGSRPIAFTIHPNGTHLYVSNLVSQNVSVFLLDASGNVTGQQTMSPFGGVGSSPSGIAINPVTRSRLYIANQSGSSALSALSLDASGDVGPTAANAPSVAGTAPYAVAVHPTGRRLYVATQVNNILVYALDANGDFAGQTADSPRAGPNVSSDVVVNTAGTRLYVGDGTGVFVFPLDPATGDVTGAGVHFSTGAQTSNLAINPTNTRLYVAAGNTSQMFALVIDAAGNITGEAPGSPFTSGDSNPTGIAVR
jgi:6-phosphogluconolactonase